jgi:hypothetical protein
MLMTYLQQLATRKISKNRQNSKANSFFLSRNIDLAAKTPQKRPVFSVSTKTWCGDLIVKALRQSKLRLLLERQFSARQFALTGLGCHPSPKCAHQCGGFDSVTALPFDRRRWNGFQRSSNNLGWKSRN